MSLTAKLTDAVNKAFAAAGDLVKTGTLSNKTVSGYDFSTGQTVSTSSTKSVEVIITTKSLPSGGGYSVEGMMKSGYSVDAYDTLTVGSDVYNITNVADDSFVITLTLSKEK